MKNQRVEALILELRSIERELGRVCCFSVRARELVDKRREVRCQLREMGVDPEEVSTL